MTSKKNMRTNRTPRRIHRNKGGRKKGTIAPMIKKYYNFGAADDEFGIIRNEDDYNRLKKKYEVKN
jgi:hypothetical protein|tara:strand:- start:570 stop:767 length:198 start_codon:yes stop_codon:yes gene_type:complete